MMFLRRENEMGTVVTMPAPRRKLSARAAKTNKATILLFMGVRYVRELDPTDHLTAPEQQASGGSAGAFNPLAIA